MLAVSIHLVFSAGIFAEGSFRAEFELSCLGFSHSSAFSRAFPFFSLFPKPWNLSSALRIPCPARLFFPGFFPTVCPLRTGSVVALPLETVIFPQIRRPVFVFRKTLCTGRTHSNCGISAVASSFGECLCALYVNPHNDACADIPANLFSPCRFSPFSHDFSLQQAACSLSRRLRLLIERSRSPFPF